jgi:glutaredoxin 3
MAKVVMYTTRYCPYCMRAKRLLRHKGAPFEEIDVGDDDALRDKMAAESGRRSVPQILINGRAIGGFDELHALDQRGELDVLLAEDSPPVNQS